MSAPQQPAAIGRGEDAGSPPTPNVRPQRGSITSLLILSLVFLMMTNNGGDGLSARDQYMDSLSSLEWQLGNYSVWLNGSDTSNFTLPSRPLAESHIVSEVVHRSGALDPLVQSYFPNITGFIRGDASFRNVSSELVPTIEWNETEVALKLGRWNWSATTRVSMNLLSKPAQVNDEQEKEEFQGVAMLHGHLEFIDGNNAREMQLDFAGIQFMETGSVYGFAQDPGVSIDIRALPSLVPPDLLNITARAVVPVLEDNIAKLKTLLTSNDLTELNPTPPESACHFAVYAQVLPSNISAVNMRELEDELMTPTGVSTVKRPPLELDLAAISPDCGVLVEASKADGIRSRIFFRKITSYGGFAGLVYLGLLLLLSHQMSESRTPASLSRISRWSFIVQALADAMAFAGHMTFAILADGRPSIALVAPAFLACALFAYEVQFVLLIQQVQAPEDLAAALPPPSVPSPRPTSPTRPASPSENTLPIALTGAVPANAQDANATAPSQESVSFFSIVRFIIQLAWYDDHNRIWYLILIVLALVVRVVVAPGLAVFLLAVLYSSIWVPQIVRAARRGRPCTLGRKYVIGTTVGRMLLATYFLGCPKNVLQAEPRPWVYALSLFACAQAVLLGLQDSVGPAFFLPQRLADSQGYDYHPPLPDTESGPLGDCAICMDAIERPPEDTSGKPRRRGARDRASYSLAPCAHLFHTECLERWLAIKNICPQCRRPLPPL